MGVVGADGQAGAQQVPGDVELAVGAVDLGVLAERGGDPEPVIGLAGDDIAAGAHVARDVHVVVDEAEDPPVLDHRGRAVHGGVHPGLGEGGAAAAGHERQRGAAPAGQRQRAAPRAGDDAAVARGGAQGEPDPEPTAVSANSVGGPAAATRVTVPAGSALIRRAPAS